MANEIRRKVGVCMCRRAGVHNVRLLADENGGKYSYVFPKEMFFVLAEAVGLRTLLAVLLEV